MKFFKGGAKGNSEEIRRLNQSFETFEHHTREIHNKFILTGQLIIGNRIKNELLGLNMPVHYLVKEFEKFVGEIERKIVNHGVAFGWLEKDPCATFQGKHEKTRRTFLTQAELDRIERKEISLDRQNI